MALPYPVEYRQGVCPGTCAPLWPIACDLRVVASNWCRRRYRVLDVRFVVDPLVVGRMGRLGPSRGRLGGPAWCAVVTGWAVDPGYVVRAGGDAAVGCWSAHADVDEPCGYVERRRAAPVYTLDVAAEPRRRGHHAHPHVGSRQHSLPSV